MGALILLALGVFVVAQKAPARRAPAGFSRTGIRGPASLLASAPRGGKTAGGVAAGAASGGAKGGGRSLGSSIGTRAAQEGCARAGVPMELQGVCGSIGGKVGGAVEDAVEFVGDALSDLNPF